MDKVINYGRQTISEEDIESVVQVLRSNYLTQGPIGKDFEKAFSEIVSLNMLLHSIALQVLSSACLALGVGPDDYVWTSQFHLSPRPIVHCVVPT